MSTRYNKHVYQNDKLSAVGYTGWWWSKPENQVIAIKGDDEIRSLVEWKKLILLKRMLPKWLLILQSHGLYVIAYRSEVWFVYQFDPSIFTATARNYKFWTSAAASFHCLIQKICHLQLGRVQEL